MLTLNALLEVIQIKNIFTRNCTKVHTKSKLYIKVSIAKK